MNQPPKDLSLANIHQIYNGAVVKPSVTSKRQPTADGAAPTYKTTNQFARESSHSGAAPSPLPASGKHSRRKP